MTQTSFIDGYDSDPLVLVRQQREMCVDEVYKEPGITSAQIASRLGFPFERTKQLMDEAKHYGDVWRKHDCWYPAEDR